MQEMGGAGVAWSERKLKWACRTGCRTRTPPPVYSWCGDVEFESHSKSWLKSSVVELEPEPQESQLFPKRNDNLNDLFRFRIWIRIQHKMELEIKKLKMRWQFFGKQCCITLKRQDFCTNSFSLKICAKYGLDSGSASGFGSRTRRNRNRNLNETETFQSRNRNRNKSICRYGSTT